VKIKDLINKRLNAEFRERLAGFAKTHMNIEIETHFSIFSMQISSSRTDGKKFTKSQYQRLQDFESGYVAAMVEASK